MIVITIVVKELEDKSIHFQAKTVELSSTEAEREAAMQANELIHNGLLDVAPKSKAVLN